MRARAAVRAAAAAGLGVGVTAAALLGPAAPAAAHVSIQPSTTVAGEVAVLTLGVDHGCEGSATVALVVRVPDGAGPVTASGGDRWTTTTGPDADGGTLVTYRAADPLPDDLPGEVGVTLRLPDAPGTTLAFPTVQECEQGEIAWIEVAAPGQPTGELTRPAPSLTTTGPEDTSGAGGAPAPAAGPAHGHGAASAAPQSGAAGTRTAAAAAAAGTGLMGALLAAAVALLVRRRPRWPR